MGFFDNIGKGISDFSQATIQKGKDVANVARYNRMIAEEERTTSRLFEALGRKYVELHASDYEEDFADLAGQIVESGQKIEEYTELVKELQGITRCAECGSDIPNGASFCPECGARAIRKADDGQSGGDAQGKPKKQFCTNCGALIVPGYKYCAACGMKIEPPAEEVTEETAEEVTEETAEEAAETEKPDEIIFPEFQAQEPEEGPVEDQ